jgi:hypothetical protein
VYRFMLYSGLGLTSAVQRTRACALSHQPE